MNAYETAAAAADFGTPTARKTGRDARWPYVPVLVITDDTGREHDSQILGLAFATREEAIHAAERHVRTQRAVLTRLLAEPRMRALREQHGLPREIDR